MKMAHRLILPRQKNQCCYLMQLIFQSLIPLFTSTVIIPTVFYFFAFTLAQFPTANPSRPISPWLWAQQRRLTWLMVPLHAIVCWCKLVVFFFAVYISVKPRKTQTKKWLPAPASGSGRWPNAHFIHVTHHPTHNHNSFPHCWASQASLFVPAPLSGCITLTRTDISSSHTN